MENVFVELVSRVQQFEAHAQKPVFADIYQFVVVTARTDAKNSRSGDFCDSRQTDYFTPCACVQGKYCPGAGHDTAYDTIQVEYCPIHQLNRTRLFKF